MFCLLRVEREVQTSITRCSSTIQQSSTLWVIQKCVYKNDKCIEINMFITTVLSSFKSWRFRSSSISFWSILTQSQIESQIEMAMNWMVLESSLLLTFLRMNESICLRSAPKIWFRVKSALMLSMRYLRQRQHRSKYVQLKYSESS